jgi:hypothetical protein
MAAVPTAAQISANRIADTCPASGKTRRGNPADGRDDSGTNGGTTSAAGRAMATPSPDTAGPVEANKSTGAVGKAGERREVGNVVASVMDKKTDNGVKSSVYDAEILSPRAGPLRHLWQNAPLHQPGKRVRAA